MSSDESQTNSDEEPMSSEDPMSSDESQTNSDEEPVSSDEPTTLRFTGVPGQEGDVGDGVDTRGLSAEDQATIEALRPGTALLVVQRGPNTGARFLLDAAEVTAGRHPDSDIFLDDVTVSRKHAVFVASGSGFIVRDAGSLNGTYVNRERIDDTALHTGDEVQVGKFRLVYYSG